MKVLAIGTYDAILGMDWLEEHSPMTVDWRAKLIEIPSTSGAIRLQGHEATSSTCTVINALQLQQLCNTDAITHMALIYAMTNEGSNNTTSPEIQAVLEEFSDVFKEPEGLPPRRDCDHKIPLIPGAQPVNIRPSRHKPEHKKEIDA